MKRISPNRIKTKYSYSVQELADLLQVQSNTILRWVKTEGLTTIDDSIPIFVYGQEIKNFLKFRNLKNKRKLQLGQFFCCKCRLPKFSQKSLMSIHSESDKIYRAKGVCEECGTKLNRILSKQMYQKLQIFLSSDDSISGLVEYETLDLNNRDREVKKMCEYNPENERIKSKFFIFEKEANGKSDKTIDKLRKEIIRYEAFTKYDSFKSFNQDKAIEFKAYLLKAKNTKGTPLSSSTIVHTLKSVQLLLKWLTLQQGYKSSIKLQDIEFLNISEKERHKMKPAKLKEHPSPEQIEFVINSMELNDEISMRNRAIIAFIFATGIRDGALIGLKLKHINIDNKYVIQDSREVDTKFGKTINTKFFPVGEGIHQIIIDWVKYLRKTKLFNDQSPLFPKEGLKHDGSFTIKRGFISNEHWKTPTSVRKIVKNSFESLGLTSFPPHRFRDTISSIGRKLCQTTEEQMAWAKNLGHESPITTFMVYGNFSPEQQFDVIERMSDPRKLLLPENLEDLLEAFMNKTLAKKE